MQSGDDKQKQGKKRQLKDGGEFVCFRQFSNTLPNAPSGPFFKPKTMSQSSFGKYANYEVSSLEKSFIWQPHFGLDVGINIDLVDQDELLRVFPPNTPINPEDFKYIQADKSKKKVRGIESFGEKPWWLRNTTYLENNLYKVTTRENSAIRRKLNVQRTIGDPLSVDVIESSFEDVMKTVDEQISQAVSSGKSMEWCVEFLPEISEDNATFSLVRFDEDPKKLVEITNKRDGGSRTLLKSIVTNTRKSHTADTRNAIFTSLVAATADDMANGSAQYDWISDFKMDVKAGETDDYLIIINANNNGETDGAARFCQMQSRVEMRKLAGQDSEPHESLVSRRPSQVSGSAPN